MYRIIQGKTCIINFASAQTLKLLTKPQQNSGRAKQEKQQQMHLQQQIQQQFHPSQKKINKPHPQSQGAPGRGSK